MTDRQAQLSCLRPIRVQETEPLIEIPHLADIQFDNITHNNNQWIISGCAAEMVQIHTYL